MTLHIFVFINITFVVKPVHIFMARSRTSKSYLMAELCFQRFVHFGCVPIYIFSAHHKPCAGDYDFNFVKFTSQMFSSVDESLKEEMRAHFVLIHITSAVKQMQCTSPRQVQRDLETVMPVWIPKPRNRVELPHDGGCYHIETSPLDWFLYDNSFRHERVKQDF